MIAKVTGRSKYAEDYRADGMLFTKLLLSPMPHARVRHIDASEALKMPGVFAILTADELPVVAPPTRGAAAAEEEGPASKGGRGTPIKAEMGLTQRAGVSRPTDSRGGGDRRIDRGRGHRAHQNRLRAAAILRRSTGEPASRRPQRAHGRQRLLRHGSEDAQVDRRRLERSRSGPAADARSAGYLDGGRCRRRLQRSRSHHR